MEWEEIYASGKQLNDYPFDDVVSFVRKYGKPGQSILELGCGAGNNLVWAHKEGYVIVGIDSSESAIERAQSKIKGAGYFYCQDFNNIPVPPYDLIIDRYATTYLFGFQEIKILNHKIKEALKPGGYYFTQLASAANTQELDPKPNLYNETEIARLFEDWNIISLKHRIESDVIEGTHYAVWNIIVQK